MCHATKSGIPVALAVLQHLAIPTFVLFDGDNRCNEEMRASHERMNTAIQALCSVEAPEAFPTTQINETWGVLEGDLEAHLREAVADWDARCTTESTGRDWRAKSAETYAAVVADLDERPLRLVETIQAVRHLAGIP